MRFKNLLDVFVLTDLTLVQSYHLSRKKKTICRPFEKIIIISGLRYKEKIEQIRNVSFRGLTLSERQSSSVYNELLTMSACAVKYKC